MAAVLGAVFVALALSAALGFVIGLRYARTVPETTTVDDEVAVDEATMAERLEQAEADLAAHAVELRDANEEITCLLEQLHEARTETA